MAYQYKLTWTDIPDDMVEEETKRIKKGDRLYCNKTLYLHDSQEVAFIKGKVYTAPEDGYVLDEDGINHELGEWREFFTLTPHPVEKCNCDKCEEVKDRDYFQSVQEEYGVPVTGTPITDKRTFETGAVRDSNKGKPFIHTLLGYTRQRFGYHMAKNADKYGPFNFLKGIPTEAALESLDRHLAAYMAGDRSEDHLSAIIFGVQCCMLNEERDGIPANHYFED